MTCPFDELLKINIAVNVAMYELHSRMIENVDLGGALHYLNGESIRQGKLRRILFEPQIPNSLNKRVGVRVLRACSGSSRGDRILKRRLFFQARDGRAESNLYGAQPLGAFEDVGRVFGPDIPVLGARILEEDGCGRTRGGSVTDRMIHYSTYENGNGNGTSRGATERAPQQHHVKLENHLLSSDRTK